MPLSLGLQLEHSLKVHSHACYEDLQAAGMYWIQLFNSGWKGMWLDIRWRMRPEPDSMVPLLCMLMMCMKLCNLHINYSVLMSVI